MRPTRTTFWTRYGAMGAAAAATVAFCGMMQFADAAPVPEPEPEPDQAAFVPLTPCRMVDTRPAPDNVGPKLGPVGPGEALTLPGRGSIGNCMLPTTLTGLVVNVTAIGATTPTNLQLYPTGESPPGTSNLNPVPGLPPTPNAATIALSSTGQFDLLNALGSVDVIVDVIGAFEPLSTP